VRRLTLTLLFLAALLLLVAALPSQVFQQAVASIMPPPAPSNSCPDMSPSPDYYLDGSEHTAIAAINHARASEGLPTLHLPGNYWQLSISQQQFTLVNLERTSRGLAPLRWDANLAEIANAYSQQMAQLRFFSHTSPISGDFPTRLNANPQVAGHYTSIAENIAGNWAPAAGAMYEYLYHDASEQCAHRQNILNPAFTLIGIGVAAGGPWGMMSAQELLASNPADPYQGTPPDTTPPTIRIITSLNRAQDTLHLMAHASDNQGLARLIWYLDGIGHLSHAGADWTITTRQLTAGHHVLFAYAVDTSQHYATATLGFTLDPRGIMLEA
jgi:uncharacterized protein YkwD